MKWSKKYWFGILGEIYPVPIVPLTEENENAMEQSSFIKVLKALGLAPPTTGQVSGHL